MDPLFVGVGDPHGVFQFNAFDHFAPMPAFDQSRQFAHAAHAPPNAGPWMGGFPGQQGLPATPHVQAFQAQFAPSVGDASIDAVGWGGQAIPDNNGYRAPWFGRSPGKGGNARGGRGKGRHSGNDHRGQQRNKGRWNGNRSSNESSSASDDVMTLEDMVALVRSCRNDQPLCHEVYRGLRHFDSRTCSGLLKDLSKMGLGNRAMQIFDGLRESGAQDLRALCDVYTYTAMISMCIYQQNVDRALRLVEEMRQRGIERNVHTYTALMNVCIKCGKCQLALESYNKMLEDGITPNVVTYNTLIDIYGKMGQWEQAVKVLVNMRSQGVEAVLRTYNTLIITCNMCNQPREALAVYNRLLSEGFSPNATTYNALISAYGKAGQLDKVMEVFEEMMRKGCERSVITYSSLISACEKAGQWEVALELFTEMQKEGCVPNTVTFNSLITACAQGAQWEKASEVFDQMRDQGCAPDVVTYTALISANERGGQWRRALGAYERMNRQGCRPDAIVYNAIIDAVWETGVIWAQRKALSIYKTARSQGHFKQQTLRNVPRSEVNLHALTAGVAVLSLYSWLLELKLLLLREGADALPETLCIVTDKGRTSKEQGNLVVKEAVAAMMNSWNAPFKPTQDSSYAGVLEASGRDVAFWLAGPTFEERLFGFFPCTNITPALANQIPFEEGLNSDNNGLIDDPSFAEEVAVEARCSEAFAHVHQFESTHSLTLQAMGLPYLQHRAELVQRMLKYGKQMNLREEIAHDAVLLMDRAMSTSYQVKENLLELLSVACLVLVMKQTERAENLPSDELLEQITDCKASAVEKMEYNLHHVLGGDTSTISTLRCIMLYLERLGSRFLDGRTAAEVAGNAVSLVERSMSVLTFLNCRPSVVAAAILYAERRSRGVIPFWPSMLAKLTGYQDMSSPELTVAIRDAQKLCQWTSDSPVSTTDATVIPSYALMAESGVDSISASESTSFLVNAASSNDLMEPVGQAISLGLLNLEPSLSFPPYDSLGPLSSVQNMNQPQAPVRSHSADDHQVIANRVDGVVVAQGATMPPGVVQSLSYVTSGFPSIIPHSHALLGSTTQSTRMNPNPIPVSASGGIDVTKVLDN